MQTDSHASDFSSECVGRPTDSALSFAEEKICGTGASCVVYENIIGGLRVAVKRLRQECLLEPTYRASYRKEFEIGQRLKHDGLPMYRDFYEGDDEVYIVMEYIDGVTLKDFLKTDAGQKYFSIADNARKFFMQLVNIVGYLHRCGVIHCDIKPANIMLRHSDRGVMLLDLDKSYSDALDRTHGGTRMNSDPLQHGDKPSVRKDYIGIGNLVDDIAGSGPRMAVGRFRKFRKECKNSNASYDSLCKALKPDTRIRIIGLAGLFIIAVIAALFQSRGEMQHNELKTESGRIVKEEILDTVHIEEAGPVVKAKEADGSRICVITPSELDAEMADFIKEVKESLSVLSSDSVQEDWYMEAMGSLSISYSSKIYEVIKKYKSKYPYISGQDVEYDVLMAANKSQAKNMLNKFMGYNSRDAVPVTHDAGSESVDSDQSASYDNLE